jgi:hypothetical protein
MNQRMTFILTSVTLLGLAIVLPQAAFAQSNPFKSLVGTWKLNLAKSTYSPGPLPRSGTLTFQEEGQGLRSTVETIDAQGNPTKRVNVIFDDGKSHPTTGVPGYDASSIKTVNDFTIWDLRTKAGKVVQTLIVTISPDGKTHTIATTGVDATGQQINNVAVYDKQ